MSIVAVIGADTLGGSIAHKLATRDRVSEVWLVDTSSIAAGKALDIQQAAAVEHFHTRVRAHSNLSAVSNAEVIVLAGPAHVAEAGGSGESDVQLLERLFAYNRRAVIVCAGVSSRRLIARGVADLRIPRHQLIGSAPFAFQAALQAIVAVELRCSASQVSLGVLGTPPEHPVIPWSEATVRGVSIIQTLDPPRLARLRAKVPLAWPPGPYTLASTAARVCEAVISGTGLRGVPCFVVLDGELGARGTAAAVTVELGAAGVTRVTNPSLTGQERVQLQTALLEG